MADDTTESTSEGFPRGCLTVTLTHVGHARTEALRDQRVCFFQVFYFQTFCDQVASSFLPPAFFVVAFRLDGLDCLERAQKAASLWRHPLRACVEASSQTADGRNAIDLVSPGLLPSYLRTAWFSMSILIWAVVVVL